MKCRRLSSESEGIVGGTGLSVASSTETPFRGVKLTIKTTVGGNRKANATVPAACSTESPLVTSKKKGGRPGSSAKQRKRYEQSQMFTSLDSVSSSSHAPPSPEESPKISYTLGQ